MNPMEHTKYIVIALTTLAMAGCLSETNLPAPDDMSVDERDGNAISLLGDAGAVDLEPADEPDANGSVEESEPEPEPDAGTVESEADAAVEPEPEPEPDAGGEVEPDASTEPEGDAAVEPEPDAGGEVEPDPCGRTCTPGMCGVYEDTCGGEFYCNPCNQKGVCRGTVAVCVDPGGSDGAGFSCVYRDMGAEVCGDDKDNDCDGEVDNACN